jgi:hypothetical protein
MRGPRRLFWVLVFWLGLSLLGLLAPLWLAAALGYFEAKRHWDFWFAKVLEAHHTEENEHGTL